MFVTISGPHGSLVSILDGLMSQYSNFWACDVKPVIVRAPLLVTI